MTNKMHYQHDWKAVTPDQQTIVDRVTTALEASGFTIESVEFGELVVIRVPRAELSYTEAFTRAYVAFSQGPIVIRGMSYLADDADCYRISLEVRVPQAQCEAINA